MSAYLRNCALAALIFVAMLPNAPAVAADAQTYVVLHASEPPLAAGSGRFYFYREDGLLGMAIQPTIMINGQSAGGRAKPGDYFYVDVPAGSYRISTETEKEEAISTNIAVGESLYIRFDVHMGLFAGHVSPSVIDAQKAATEIKDCDFHTPKSIPSFATPAATPVADAAPATTPSTGSAATLAPVADAVPAATTTPTATPAPPSPAEPATAPFPASQTPQADPTTKSD